MARFRAAAYATAQLMVQGMHIFSPIAHTHPVQRADEALSYGYTHWKLWDEEMMGFCESIIVLKIEGWEQSVGVLAEIKYMREAGKPVAYLDPHDVGMSAQLPHVIVPMVI